MKISYTCEYCGNHIDTLEVDQVDETKLGFDCLTEQERQDIIKHDAGLNIMYVKSLCDSCITSIGLSEDFAVGLPTITRNYLH